MIDAAGTTKVGQASSLPIKLDLPNTSYITNTFDSVALIESTVADRIEFEFDCRPSKWRL